ncbi:MAG: D-glycero-beta-D-manno-heptose-7-phosphate kinase [Proteobacteria bacterium]|nr:D-glycero-beta-D-manno-heptose-7-phosphate kinase [Pseudomonadota bacterium]
MTDHSTLAAHLERLAGGRVLCVGDVMLDRYLSGEVERISPEAPVPVLKVAAEEAMLGGAGNVVRNLSALGAEAVFAAVVGDDAAGREVAALLAGARGIEARLVVEKGRMTGIKTRLIAASQHLLRADRETLAPIAGRTRGALMRAVAEALPGVGVMVLSDYGKGVLGAPLTRALIAAAREAGKRVIVDPKGSDYRRYRGASVITPNRRELAAATGLATGSDEEVAAASRRLMERIGVDAVLATRGGDGMTLVVGAGRRETVRHLRAEAREVFDVSGAGDTVVATLAAALAAGVPLADAARLANVAAGIVVGKVGTAVAHPDELVHALHARDLLTGEAKVMALAPAVERLATWRRSGLKVGFTNGCFDLLHPGHVSLLAQARAACDRLVVGLNSDASVARLKGRGRPIQGEAARAAVLASLATVDLVVIFAEDTPIRLIEALRPDVLVKGSDYRLDEVVGGDLVRSYGGRVLLAELVAGHSTSATIARMAK